MKRTRKTDFSALRYPSSAPRPQNRVETYICPYHAEEKRQREENDLSFLDRIFQNHNDEWVFVKGCAECQDRFDRERFGDLDNIKYHYEIATGYLGRWLTILEKWYRGEEKTIQIATDFLQWAVLSETVFLEETKAVRESQEYQTWFTKDAEDDRLSFLTHRRSRDWTWKAMKAVKLGCYWGDPEHAAQIISTLRQSLETGRFTDAVAAERNRFLQSDLKHENERTLWLNRLFCSKSITVNPPWLFQGIKNQLHAWEQGGRSKGLDLFVQRKKASVFDWESSRELDNEFDQMYGVIYGPWNGDYSKV